MRRMIEENIIRVYEILKGKSILQTKDTNRQEWSLMFKFYNEHKEPGTKDLKIDCLPCYAKVLQFVSAQIKKYSATRAGSGLIRETISEGDLYTTIVRTEDGKISSELTMEAKTEDAAELNGIIEQMYISCENSIKKLLVDEFRSQNIV